MNRLRRTLGIGALVLALSGGCFEQPTNSGRILEKRHEPQREYERENVLAGKVPIFFKETMVDDEDFIIVFGEREGKNRTIYVTKEVYNSLKVGDNFDISKIPSKEFDEDYRKVK